MEVIVDFLGQAVPFVVAGFIAAVAGTFIGNKRK